MFETEKTLGKRVRRKGLPSRPPTHCGWAALKPLDLDGAERRPTRLRGLHPCQAGYASRFSSRPVLVRGAGWRTFGKSRDLVFFEPFAPPCPCPCPCPSVPSVPSPLPYPALPLRSALWPLYPPCPAPCAKQRRTGNNQWNQPAADSSLSKQQATQTTMTASTGEQRKCLRTY